MHTTPQERFSAIFTMLIELAMGDLSFRIHAERNSVEDGLNIFANRLQNDIDNSDSSDAYFSYNGIVQYVVIVNEDFLIKAFSPSFSSRLKYMPKELLGKEITQFIIGDREDFILRLKYHLSDTESNKIMKLNFRSSDSLLLPVSCMVSSSIGTAEIIIAAVLFDLNDRITLKHFENSKDISVSEIQIAIALHSYIIENLGKPLPTIKILCRMLGTNEFTIKHSFKKQYNSSIYQFYNSERLKRAHLMVQQTNLSLKEVSANSGFNDYVNFSKAFKKKYGYTPGKLLRKQ